MTLDEVKGKLKSLTQGQKSDAVVGRMANTFKDLAELADWAATAARPAKEESEPLPVQPLPLTSQETPRRELELHYNIQLILPESRDQAVYDALFSGLRRHLL
jgi:hypothetical protein